MYAEDSASHPGDGVDPQTQAQMAHLPQLRARLVERRVPFPLLSQSSEVFHENKAVGMDPTILLGLEERYER